MSDYPFDPAERDELLAMPDGYTPSRAKLLEAVRAYKMWDIAEDQGLGSFQDRMDLCSYAQWAGDRALGRPHAEQWEGER